MTKATKVSWPQRRVVTIYTSRSANQKVAWDWREYEDLPFPMNLVFGTSLMVIIVIISLEQALSRMSSLNRSLSLTACPWRSWGAPWAVEKEEEKSDSPPSSMYSSYEWGCDWAGWSPTFFLLRAPDEHASRRNVVVDDGKLTPVQGECCVLVYWLSDSWVPTLIPVPRWSVSCIWLLDLHRTPLATNFDAACMPCHVEARPEPILQ